MSEEELKIIENTINENKDYREHFHLHDYFEVEYIDKLVTSYKQIQQENKELKADLEMYENGVYFSSENDKLQNEIDNLNHIIDKQDKDITILSKGNKHLKEVIDKAIKHVSSLSSKGRDCMIYADVKKDILDILKEADKEVSE